jgi:hypothetical protein
VYEDGWLSEAAFFDLRQPVDAHMLSLRGMLPLVDDADFTSEIQVLIDGQVVAERTLALGGFEVDAPVATAPGTHRVELHFSRLQRLLAPDTRPAAALLQSIGFTSGRASGQ